MTDDRGYRWKELGAPGRAVSPCRDRRIRLRGNAAGLVGEVTAHLDGAGSDEQQLVLEAIRLNVEATREEVTIEGILPLEPPK